MSKSIIEVVEEERTDLEAAEAFLDKDSGSLWLFGKDKPHCTARIKLDGTVRGAQGVSRATCIDSGDKPVKIVGVSVVPL